MAFACVAATAGLMFALQDLPDVEGDRQHDIQTFATQLGVRNISLAVCGCLSARAVVNPR